jgi:hypothetical protein
MKKRFLIYLSVIVGCLFIGLTTYYMVKNYEEIVITASSGNEIYLNVEETEVLSVIHRNPAKSTKFSINISDENVLSFNLETRTITALNGGEATLTITPSNEDFGPFEFKILVGDGQESTPYYVKNAKDLKAVGNTRNYSETVSHDWSLDAFYTLVNDINLDNEEWTPIGSYADNKPFSGQFFGDNKKIHNLKISKDLESAGLFAYLSDFAIIDSVKFNNVNITGSFDYVGVVAGISSGSTISRVEVTNANISVTPNIFTAINETTGAEETKAYLMAGGIVGCSDIIYWEESNASIGYGYERTNITMTSFSGTISANPECFNIASSEDVDKTYIAFGGIVGFDLGATILNNKAEVTFNVNNNLAALSINKNNVSILIGGIVGIIYPVEIEENETVVATLYPLVKNNLAILTCDTLTDETSGIIGKVPVGVQYESGQQWIIGNYFYTDNTSLTFGGSNWEYATTRVSTLSNIKKQSTYITESTSEGLILEKWDMGDSISVWIINEGKSAPEINFINGIEQEAIYPGEVYTIATILDFQKYYDKLTTPTTTPAEITSKKFWLSQNFVLEIDINLADAGITNIIPIGYDYTFMGNFNGNGHKIYFQAEESSILSFVNTSEEGTYRYRYGSLFAIINIGAEVKNLTVEKFTLDHAEFAGAIAGINLGSVVNCYVKNVKIDSALYAGSMVGFNKGRIQNLEESEEIVYSIVSSSAPNISIPNTTNSVFVGGITGYNTGLISNIKIQGVFTIIGETTENSVIRVLGGVVGYNKGEIENCSVEQSYLSDNSKVKIFVGGFCGINDGIIKNSYTGMEDVVLSTVTTDTTKGDQTAGGFVAYLGYTGIIEKSFANVSVTGYYAAGLAADLLGKVSECYVKGSVSGEYIGGFACNLAFKSDSTKGGIIENCYNTLKLTGVSETSISAGLALFIRTPGKIENCFISNIFEGLGEKYYECFTDNRSKFLQFTTSKISPAENLGTINNIVINNQASGALNEEIKVSGKLIEDKSQKVYYFDNDTCKLGSEAFVAIGFSVGPTAYWTIEAGFYPILTNLNLDGIPQIVEESPVEEAPVEEDQEG